MAEQKRNFLTSYLMKMMKISHGGKRQGSGRKHSDNKKIRVSFSLAPDVVDYLNRRTDKPKAQVIEDALREQKNKATYTTP